MNNFAEKILNRWHSFLEDKKREDVIKMAFMDYDFFFKYKKEVYAASEESRIIYSMLLDPKAESKSWKNEASFTATNLTKLLKGEKIETVFSKKDVKDIDVISDKDQVEKELHVRK